MKPIYLDHNASTPLEKSVIDKMKHVLDNQFGNPSSSHIYGIENKKLVEEAREHLAAMINADPEEIIFTSGGSESNNMAILGIASQYPKSHLISSQIEHPSVENVFEKLSNDGFKVTFIPVNRMGVFYVDNLQHIITDKTKLISVMLANNETGVIQPLEEIVKIAHLKNILVHSDAAQAAGKIEIDVKTLGVDLMTIAGHKMNGPKGVGALYIKKGVKIPPMILGADHEMGLRAGTENVLEIVGLGEAARFFTESSNQIIDHQKYLRDYFVKSLSNTIKIRINGETNEKLPNTANIYFPGCDANKILNTVPEIAASAGAACHAGSVNPSKVLKAMGFSDERALGSLRFSLGRTTTQEEIDFAVVKIVAAVKKLKVDHVIETSEKLILEPASLGCSCKLSAKKLNEILESLPSNQQNHQYSGFEDSEDASIYFFDENIILNSVDFFSPMVDDPFDFGRIAAANALSDIYAMGGQPLFANNIVAFPEKKYSQNILLKILKGAQAIALEAGIPILGGHSIKDDSVKFGLTVTGITKSGKIWRNSGANVRDKLILTKPIGTGILCKAAQKKLISDTDEQKLITMMASLNKTVCDTMKNYNISSCTDVSGFGLLGHLSEMMKASERSALIYLDKIPLFRGLKKIVRLGIVSDGYYGNYEYFEQFIYWSDNVTSSDKNILFDPQTSGGLLFTLDSDEAKDICTKSNNFHIIGDITARNSKLIEVV